MGLEPNPEATDVGMTSNRNRRLACAALFERFIQVRAGYQQGRCGAGQQRDNYGNQEREAQWGQVQAAADIHGNVADGQRGQQRPPQLRNQHDAHRHTAGGRQHGLDQKLPRDVEAPGPQRQTQAELALPPDGARQ